MEAEFKAHTVGARTYVLIGTYLQGVYFIHISIFMATLSASTYVYKSVYIYIYTYMFLHAHII